MLKSNCCNASVFANIGGEGTGYHLCKSCKEPCDIIYDEIEQRTFPGGAVRDSNKGKPRYDLIPPEALLRVAEHYARGAEKYGVDNYKKGEGMPREAFIESAMRHMEAIRLGKTDEDHPAALVWNILSLMWREEKK